MLLLKVADLTEVVKIIERIQKGYHVSGCC